MLLSAISEDCETAVIEELLISGANANAASMVMQLHQSLHCTAPVSHTLHSLDVFNLLFSLFPSLQFLLFFSLPPSPSVSSQSGCTPIIRSAQCGNVDVMEMLIKRGADITTADHVSTLNSA